MIEPTRFSNVVVSLKDRKIPAFSFLFVSVQITKGDKEAASYFMVEPSSDIFLKKGLTLGRL